MMKKTIKYIAAFFIAGVLFNSCETAELDLTEDPNALTPAQADPDFYLNVIQEDFARMVESLGETMAEVSRIENMGSRDYQNAYSPASFDNEWEEAYQQILKNIKDMNVLTNEGGLTNHTAMGQFYEAYTITLLVDMFGDVPYSQALQAPEILNPAPDAGADVYAAALGLLDNAIANFNADGSVDPQNDFFYGNDYDQWILACNTLKLSLYKNTGNNAAFNSIIASGDFIADSDDDMQFQWGTNQVQPDTRHPDYADNYTATGGADYGSIYIMNMMDTSNDPRIRYYYYRQNAVVPGSDGEAPNEETLDCSLQAPPAQYAAGGFPFCTLPNGYWGRNHGNDSGIPPDGLLRVVPGVYPVAGKFDDSSFDESGLGAGGGGNGVTPVLLASTVDFWRAEVATSGGAAAAKPFLLDGIAKSIAKVQTFGSKDSDADLSTAPTEADVTAFLAAVEADFDAANDEGKLNIWAEQFLISLKGNGHDGYNMYRRTGYPTNIEPNLELNPGAFIRSFFYPANAANTNSALSQKQNVTGQVFWDTNPASPGFPVGN